MCLISLPINNIILNFEYKNVLFRYVGCIVTQEHGDQNSAMNFNEFNQRYYVNNIF